MDNLKAVLDAQVKAWEDFKQANDQRLAAVEAKNSTGDHQVTLDKITAVIDGLGDRLKATEAAMSRTGEASQTQPSEVKAAFVNFLRKGIDTKGLQASANDDGGYLVPESVAGPLVRRIFDGSPMRQAARVIAISGNALQGAVSYGQLSVSWTDEITGSSDPTTPTLKQYRIGVNNQRSSPQVSPVMLEDASVDISAWLSEEIARDFALSEQTTFITGTGVARPRGITSYTTAATADSSRTWGQLEHVLTGTSGSFGSTSNGIDKLLDITGKLKSGYRAGAAFMMSKATLATARQLKTSNGDYIWQPSTQAGNPSVLLGYPVIEAEDMPTIAAASLSIAFGNFFSGYYIVDRTGLSVLRDPYSNNPQVTFHASRRVGGGVVDFDAIKFLKFS